MFLWHCALLLSQSVPVCVIIDLWWDFAGCRLEISQHPTKERLWWQSVGKRSDSVPLCKAQVTLLPFSACKSGESVNTISAYSASYYIIEGDFSLSNDSHVHTAVV